MIADTCAPISDPLGYRMKLALGAIRCGQLPIRRSRRCSRSLPTGMPRSLMARNKRHFLVRLAHEHGGAYPRIAGLGAAVERKIKLIQESRQMPGPERQLA